ncbi:MAG: hypothetical protein LHV68_08035 [Elusimicrobia bacterium]|nr:hypothetical protein [Candidatus Liberimonas magnetica]
MSKLPKLTGFLVVWVFLSIGTAFCEDYFISILAGGGTLLGDGNNASFARFNHPAGIALDTYGNIYIADTWNQRIRTIDSSGLVTTIAGNGTKEFSGDFNSAASASLNDPSGVTVDAYGNVYIADTANNRIRKVDGTGNITTIAGGTGVEQGNGGSAVSAVLSFPLCVAAGLSGDLYVADTANNCIRKIDSLGIISAVAGTGTAGYSGDGGKAAAARLNQPSAVAVDRLGNIFIADTLNNRIRKIDKYKQITTVAGNGKTGFQGDGGTATSAQLNSPCGVAVDEHRNVYIADTLNDRIRKVDIFGVITTIAGNGDAGRDVSSTQLRAPLGVAVDTSGNVYIADTGNNLIRKLTPNSSQE